MSEKIENVCSKVLTSIRKNAIILQTNKQTNKGTLCLARREVRLFSFNCTSKAKGGNGLNFIALFSLRGALC